MRTAPRFRLIVLGLTGTILASWLGWLPFGCRRGGEASAVELRLEELREHPDSGYFNAVVGISRIDIDHARIDRFDVVTPTSFSPLADLVWLETGGDEFNLERGDVFVVPLNRPDWRLSLVEGPNFLGSLVFWDALPEADQWHPLRTEAMALASTLQIMTEEGYRKPVPASLPQGWIKSGERLPDMDDPVGEIVYQKIRGETLREEVGILYTYLSEEERAEADSLGVPNFLKAVTDWTARYGRETELNGRPAVVWDDEGSGIFGWAFRYMYIDGETLVEVRLDSDPLEWVKSDREKALEAQTDRVFLRYGVWPVGPEKWNVLIEIRMNRSGRLMKRAEGKESVEKSFVLEDREFQEIERVLQDNRFFDLQSRSGPPGGSTSFLTALENGAFHTVEVRNFLLPPFRAVEARIRAIVLPKVNEVLD